MRSEWVLNAWQTSNTDATTYVDSLKTISASYRNLKVNIKERTAAVIEALSDAIPNPTTELQYHSAYELLVAVILSAQCTDKRVNMITPALFEAFPTVGALAAASLEEVLPYISSISYPNSKAKYLVDMANGVMTHFNGQIPSTREELMQLPGVGRKTANVMLIVYFNEPAMPVDTHVMRVSRRIGLVSESCKTPETIEKALLRHIPKEKLSTTHHLLILHGRRTCTARNPKCSACPINNLCKYHAHNAAKKIN